MLLVWWNIFGKSQEAQEQTADGSNTKYLYSLLESASNIGPFLAPTVPPEMQKAISTIPSDLDLTYISNLFGV